MRKLLARFKNNQAGATAIEYGLIAALVSVVIIGAAGAVGTNLKTTFNNISGTLGGEVGKAGAK